MVSLYHERIGIARLMCLVSGNKLYPWEDLPYHMLEICFMLNRFLMYWVGLFKCLWKEKFLVFSNLYFILVIMCKKLFSSAFKVLYFPYNKEDKNLSKRNSRLKKKTSI